MGIQFHRETYDNISQRVVASFCRGVIPFEPAASREEDAASQRDLHGFFTALYARMFEGPACFGMPTSPDDGLLSESEGKDRKQAVTAKLRRPREVMDVALGLLQELGQKGRLSGGAILIGQDEYQALFITKARARKKILSAMADAGLLTIEGDAEVAIHSPRYPRMVPALKVMAEGCAAVSDPRLAAFCFARCDFRALQPGYSPDVLSLLGFFDPEARERALRLHGFLLETGHRPTCGVGGMHAWVIQYQGPRKIKGSPLCQIEYSDRHRDPLQVRIKCASTDRLLPYFPEQPKALRDDFRRRVYPCGGASCGWCKNRKSLGPSVLDHDGEICNICWYTKPDVDHLNDDTLEIIRGYVHWHQRLA